MKNPIPSIKNKWLRKFVALIVVLPIWAAMIYPLFLLAGTGYAGMLTSLVLLILIDRALTTWNKRSRRRHVSFDEWQRTVYRKQ